MPVSGSRIDNEADLESDYLRRLTLQKSDLKTRVELHEGLKVFAGSSSGHEYADDALLQLGFLEGESGDDARALTAFFRLLYRYPQSELGDPAVREAVRLIVLNRREWAAADDQLYRVLQSRTDSDWDAQADGMEAASENRWAALVFALVENEPDVAEASEARELLEDLVR